jgi:hypothetical protein
LNKARLKNLIKEIPSKIPELESQTMLVVESKPNNPQQKVYAIFSKVCQAD